jgi:hypothetical protein
MKHFLLSLILLFALSGSAQIINRNIEPEDPYPFKIVGADTIYKSVPDMPVFPGGDGKLIEFLRQHIKYPIESRQKRTTGKVFVSYLVHADGKVSNVEILKSLDQACGSGSRAGHETYAGLDSGKTIWK